MGAPQVKVYRSNASTFYEKSPDCIYAFRGVHSRLKVEKIVKYRMYLLGGKNTCAEAIANYPDYRDAKEMEL
ncbi:hypothetical protein [Pectobacterium phage Wc4-1]|uniref:Uncharacterized protein n=1 Tax=Pectobacterium phage Wc4 TaxID=2652428 RepID=A0A5P8D4H2_9CAUD|nr:hypothetical protein [Pectobacterium phage Wc4]QFP94048.1 hypothetical protein [Pectobacterium phage Wc4-1]